MAKQRYVNTRFWSDNWVTNLDPTEKLLFIYFLTNEKTNICGIYELPLKIMATETGIEKEMIEKVIKRFSNDKKVFYINGWIYVKNFAKHQSVNESIRKGIEATMKEIPDYLMAKIKEINQADTTLGTPCIQPATYSNLNSNLNSNLSKEESEIPEVEYISEEKTNSTENKQIFAVLTAFISINPALKLNNRTQRTAIKSLIDIMGYEDLKKWVKYAISIQGQRFAPTITTPCMLLNKIAELKIHHHKNSNSQILSI